jgi:thioredoxin
MKTLKVAATVIITAICLCACGNAGARNEKKKDATASEKSVVELTSESFNAKIYDTSKEGSAYLGDKPAIVDFTATWCGPCKRLAPILEELAAEYKGRINIYKVDVDKCRDLAQAFGISSIPALLFIPIDKEPQMLIGLRGKEDLKKDIERLLLAQ